MNEKSPENLRELYRLKILFEMVITMFSYITIMLKLHKMPFVCLAIESNKFKNLKTPHYNRPYKNVFGFANQNLKFLCRVIT